MHPAYILSNLGARDTIVGCINPFKSKVPLDAACEPRLVRASCVSPCFGLLNAFAIQSCGPDQLCSEGLLCKPQVRLVFPIRNSNYPFVTSKVFIGSSLRLDGSPPTSLNQTVPSPPALCFFFPLLYLHALQHSCSRVRRWTHSSNDCLLRSVKL